MTNYLNLKEGDEFKVPLSNNSNDCSLAKIVKISQSNNPNETYEVKWLKGSGSIIWPRQEFEGKFSRGNFKLVTKKIIYEVYE